MKKIFQSAICGGIIITSYFNSAQAQDLALVSNPLKEKANLLMITNATTAETAKPLEKVNSKGTRLFIKSYKGAENIRWFHNGNGYLAMFDWYGVKAHAAYGKNGYWHYDVRFGTEKDLPAAARRLIKSNYVDFAIGNATEVNVGNQKAWVVNLEDANNLIRVRIIDGRMDELVRYDTH